MTLMTQADVFEQWAPARSPWSAWAKPVLFTQMRPGLLVAPEPAVEPVALTIAPAFHRARALVIELPGEQAAAAAIALARTGWQPVPSWNATSGENAVVDTARIVAHLAPLAPLLAAIPVSADAPPAFLLDAGRYRAQPPAPGSFDNRSIVLPQDFPSATRLRAAGIEEAIVVTTGNTSIAADLAHVLLAWQQGGVRLEQLPQDGAAPHALNVQPPSHFRRFWYRFVALTGLARANVGGFGAPIPLPQAGGRGGFYG